MLALVLPCRWWSLRTARCLSIPPLGQEALPRSTARPRRHPSFHAGLTTTLKYHEPRAGSPAASTRASRPLMITRNYRWRISIFRCRPLCCTTSCLTHCGVAGGVSDAAGVCCPRPKVPAHATSVATLKGNNPFSPPPAAGKEPHASKGRVLPPNPPIICRSR